MKNILKLSLAAALLSACATPNSPSTFGDDFPNAFNVTASFETPVMASEGDSADDPAIYIHPQGGGFIAVTDKQAGLYIYDLNGAEREFIPLGTVNNVDLRDGFIYNGQPHVLLVASNDEINAIETRLYNPASRQFITPPNARLTTGRFSPYGICLGRSVNDTFHVGVTSKAGIYEQHIVGQSNGDMTLRKVREFSTHSKTEGCVFDDRTRHLYIAEEGGGLYRFPASPTGKDEKTVIANVGDHGLVADFEGVTVYEDVNNTGYVIVSSQGNNSFGVFNISDLSFAGRFAVNDGVVDAVSTTDGIAVTSTPTPQFPRGFLITQDDMDESSTSDARKKQNVKIIDWREIEAGLSK